jgi:hypothetical protein
MMTSGERGQITRLVLSSGIRTIARFHRASVPARRNYGTTPEEEERKVHMQTGAPHHAWPPCVYVCVWFVQPMATPSTDTPCYPTRHPPLMSLNA